MELPEQMIIQKRHYNKRRRETTAGRQTWSIGTPQAGRGAYATRSIWHEASRNVKKYGAEGRSRTDTRLPPPVFETGASTIPPLRHRYELTPIHGINPPICHSFAIPALSRISTHLHKLHYTPGKRHAPRYDSPQT